MLARGCDCNRKKSNVVFYLDKELVAKTKEIGLNLSKTFENQLKQLITPFSQCNSINHFNSTIEKNEWRGKSDLNRRPLARKAPEIPSDSDLEHLLEIMG